VLTLDFPLNAPEIEEAWTFCGISNHENVEGVQRSNGGL